MQHATFNRAGGACTLITLLMSATTLVSAGSWTVTETARDTDHRLAVLPPPAIASARASDAIDVDANRTYQEVVGFGGALTEASAWVLAQLPADKRMEVIRRYYDPKDGIGYTLARTHINSCDFSLNMWSLDDVPGDYDLHHFTLEPMRRWVMPLIHDARKSAGADRFKLLASPWSPPFWMKTNYRMDDGGSLRGEYRPAWANFYVRFVQAMQREEGVPVWALTVQNEPEAHQTWESCIYKPEEERDFVRDHLGPALARAGMSGVKLLGWDHNRDNLEARADVLLGDPGVASYLWGLGLHWYVSDDYNASSRVHAKFPDKTILFTEGCFEGGSAIGAWEHGEGYATQIMADMSNWVAGYIDWNIVLDQRGGPNHVGNFCDAPVIVDTTTKEIRYGPSFYYIGHFSRFVRPGAHRVEVRGGPTALQSIAFRNPDDSIAIVLLNRTENPVAYQIAAEGERVAGTLPARGIHTVVRTGR